MTVKELSNILSGMPEEAEVTMCIDENNHQDPHDPDLYQPILIRGVFFDASANEVELREEW